MSPFQGTTKTLGRYIFCVVVSFVMAACAGQRYVVISSGSDLRQGLTIEQVERVLGTPYYQVGSTSNLGKIEARKYISADTKRDYAISYTDGRVNEIIWKDVTAELDKIQKKANAKLKHGQSKSEVREIIGSPTHISGTEFETYWTYYVSDNEIYILAFKDNILTESVRTTAADIKKTLRKEPELKYR